MIRLSGLPGISHPLQDRPYSSFHSNTDPSYWPGVFHAWNFSLNFIAVVVCIVFNFQCFRYESMNSIEIRELIKPI